MPGRAKLKKSKKKTSCLSSCVAAVKANSML
jgi:hypothetical protein